MTVRIESDRPAAGVMVGHDEGNRQRLVIGLLLIGQGGQKLDAVPGGRRGGGVGDQLVAGVIGLGQGAQDRLGRALVLGAG